MLMQSINKGYKLFYDRIGYIMKLFKHYDFFCKKGDVSKSFVPYQELFRYILPERMA